MMLKTHIAINILAILLFLPNITNKIIFVIVALIATFIPDIDNGFSTIGRTTGTWIIRFFTKHRGFFHSFSFCIIISIILAGFLPVLALPFFLGYGLHLFTDSFTAEGIRPFWPSKKESKWHFRTGGVTEFTIFIAFSLADLIVLIILFNKIF